MSPASVDIRDAVVFDGSPATVAAEASPDDARDPFRRKDPERLQRQRQGRRVAAVDRTSEGVHAGVGDVAGEQQGQVHLVRRDPADVVAVSQRRGDGVEVVADRLGEIEGDETAHGRMLAAARCVLEGWYVDDSVLSG